MSAPTEETAIETPTETEEQVNDTTTPAATESSVTNHEDLMKLVINQESELGSTKMALQQAEAELTKMQNQWKQQQDNAELETKSKAEALSKALVDSWSASLPADMMTEENKKAIFAMAQNYPKESVKMLEIAHKASAKYKTDLDSLAARQAGQAKRALESQVMDIVTKKRRVAVVPQQESVVHAASAKVAMVRNPYAFDSTQTSSSMNSVRDKNPALFQALSGFSSGNLRERMSRIAKIDGN
jgi:peptidyl-tRNA hydrolase